MAVNVNVFNVCNYTVTDLGVRQTCVCSEFLPAADLRVSTALYAGYRAQQLSYQSIALVKLFSF
jgi:hypothetical protein